ncbi:hypothetical protein CEQ23_22250 [Burkholderia cepacia]|uniref:Ammonia monooxygenase n=2 Tax=Burkholderia cepacia TaxID=292 RepID=A0ABN5CZB2_BURCE|nr:hypothetical protein CEQ23_22250 [Burkholderia cepacia]ATF79445.1 hypothetical protein CO711_17005 [Burkholderia cepacia]QCY05051.1 hypothetical protein EJ998_08695 [Burkholderia cepacia ATCC 25416]
MLFECPGCDMLHVVYVKDGRSNGRPVWQWNGSMAKPTFSPSVLVRYPCGESREERVCHSFVREGRIQYLNDCTHALAGQTVDLPEIEP